MGQDQVGMLTCIWAWLSTTYDQALRCRAVGTVAQVGPRQEPQLKVAPLDQGSALAMVTVWHLGAWVPAAKLPGMGRVHAGSCH